MARPVGWSGAPVLAEANERVLACNDDLVRIDAEFHLIGYTPEGCATGAGCGLTDQRPAAAKGADRPRWGDQARRQKAITIRFARALGCQLQRLVGRRPA